MSFELLKKSRKKTKPGDIFVFKPKGKNYYFGRTIKIDAELGGCECVLVYLYNISSLNKFDIPELNKNNLLIEPIGTNYLGWSRGYFETVGFKELNEIDIFHPHCFYDGDRNIYFDEMGNKLDKAYEPVGMFGLLGIKGIELKISKKLENC